MKADQECDLGHKLARLQAIDDEVRRHADDAITTRIRLQDARNRYHALHQVIASTYGRQNAPALDPAIHGPRPNSTKRKTSERTE